MVTYSIVPSFISVRTASNR